MKKSFNIIALAALVVIVSAFYVTSDVNNSASSGMTGGEPPAPGVGSEGKIISPAVHARNLSAARALQAPDAGMREIARAIIEGKANKPMMREFFWMYPRMYPFADPIPTNWRKSVLEHPASLSPRQLNYTSGQHPILRGSKVNAPGDWTALGPSNIPGRMTGLAIHPSDSNTMYAGGADGGVWKTTDAGANWFATGDAEATMAIGSIVVDPTDGNIVYAGTGEGNFAIDNYTGMGVLKTTNGGTSWTLGTSFSTAIRKLAIDPSNTQKLYAACDGGLFRTTTGGTSWSKVTSGLGSGYEYGTDVLFDPSNSQNVYCAFGRIWGDTQNGVYKSTNGGTSFSKLGGGLPTVNVGRIALAIAPSAPTILFAAIQSSATFQLLGLYKSTDAGANWTDMSAPGFCSSQCWYDIVVAVDPANSDIVYLGGIDTYKSTNGGTSFVKKSDWWRSPGDVNYVHADQHGILAPAANEVYFVCDGGVSHSTDAGENWALTSGGMETTQYYSIAMHPSDANLTYGGTQDNGTHRYNGALGTWTEVYGGDGGYTAVDFNTPTTVYTEYVYLDIRKSLNSGGSWSASSTGISGADRVQFIAPFTMDPNDSQTLYAGTYRIYKTTDGAANWAAVSGDVTSGENVSAVQVSPADSQVVWSGSTDGRVYLSTDSGGSWNNKNTGTIPNRYITRVTPHPTDPQIAYLMVSGFGSGHVFRTANQGMSWTNVSTGLPDQPVNTMWIDPATPTTLVIGTDIAIYRSMDEGGSWSKWANGLPNVAVTELDFEPALNLLRAATHGRGIWETDMSSGGIAPGEPSAPGETPLTMVNAADTIEVEEESDAASYSVYEGSFGTWYTPDATSCNQAGSVTLGRVSLTHTMAVGTHWYLVSASSASGESGLGMDSAAAQRDAAVSAWRCGATP